MKIFKMLLVAVGLYTISLTGIKADLNGCKQCRSVHTHYVLEDHLLYTYNPSWLKCLYTGSELECLHLDTETVLIVTLNDADTNYPVGDFPQRVHQCFTDDTMCADNG
jgi:hypothetical protein